MTPLPSIEHRRSVRSFQPKPVEEEKLYQVLQAARLAPSSNNKQPWRFIVVREESQRQALARADHNQSWMLSAPLFIVCVADLAARMSNTITLVVDEHSDLWELKRVIRDTAIATGYLLLEADALGLATCWTGFFKQAEVRPILNLPGDKFVVAIVAFGYPAEEPKPRPRLPLAKLVRFERWED